MKRVLAVSAILIGFATGASALCPAPGAIGPNDTVIQFSNQSASGSVGALGKKSELNARLPGTLYYDHAAKSLKLCDGANWIGVGDTGAASGGGTFAVGAIWTRSFAVGETVTTPIVDTGNYEMTITQHATAGGCTSEYQQTNGSWQPLGFASESSGDNEKLDAAVSLYGQDGGSYRYSEKYHRKDYTTQYPDYGTLHWSGIGSASWNGKLRFTSPSPSPSCGLTIRLLRTQ